MSAATARRCAGRLASPRRASFHRALHHGVRPHTSIRPWMRVPTDGWLLRDFLREALYNRDDGYFANASSPPVGAMSAPIPFHALLGQEDYARTLARRYDALASQWLTPVEIFKPHYARAVARHILRAHRAELDAPLVDDGERERRRGRRRVGTTPLRIYELGGGTGTCAAGILAHIRDDDPEVFASTEYVGVEISPTLAKMQRETVRREMGDDVNIVIGGVNGGGGKGGGNGGDKNAGRATYSVERRDALDAARWGPVDDAKCFVVALEVLDNLPHDRVLLLRDDVRSMGGETRLAQTRVFARRRGEDNAVDGFEQREEPLRDPLIARALEAIGEDESFFAFGFFDVRAMADRWIRGARDWNARFVPTGALALLETLHERRPRHRLVAADFDSLPNVRVPGINAPLVATQSPGGRTEDLPTYLDEVGACDVFFPTNFEHLARLDAFARSRARGTGGSKRLENGSSRRPKRSAEIVTTREFMRRHADLGATATGSGYNPLTQDFANTKFFLS